MRRCYLPFVHCKSDTSSASVFENVAWLLQANTLKKPDKMRFAIKISIEFVNPCGRELFPRRKQQCNTSTKSIVNLKGNLIRMSQTGRKTSKNQHNFCLFILLFINRTSPSLDNIHPPSRSTCFFYSTSTTQLDEVSHPVSGLISPRASRCLSLMPTTVPQNFQSLFPFVRD